ncbi:hypothetical protein THAOC_28913 [Thalassiosira oceanica]|uniref:Uncharacterized protein n=1 Tax=Thalassiosira oceanica TaxID=159749 RepID=K0RDR1_THAOC|nr:hypothetical protein THAOC_28913 [Thalassiosira oceanica]|eukprot:EJK51873.1 hypothetical protein THAOC_28913 [Thalassiosira oceanica]
MHRLHAGEKQNARRPTQESRGGGGPGSVSDAEVDLAMLLSRSTKKINQLLGLALLGRAASALWLGRRAVVSVVDDGAVRALSWSLLPRWVLWPEHSSSEGELLATCMVSLSIILPPIRSQPLPGTRQ